MRTVLSIIILLSACRAHKSLQQLTPYPYIAYNYKVTLLANNQFIGQDTVLITYYPTGEKKNEGHHAFDKNHFPTQLKIGRFVEFYRSGAVKSTGNYEISSYIDCGIAGYEREFYNFKDSTWTYYFENRKVQAKGKYAVIKTKIETRCEGGDSLIYGITNGSWEYYDSSGQKIKEPSNAQTQEFEKVTENHNQMETGFRYDRQKQQVITIYQRAQ